jgi:Phage portal protein, SPP1 Gp6-like
VDFSNEQVDFIFNRDIMINEAQVIQDIRNSVGILSEETLIANHPYVTDVKAELDRKASERDEAMPKSTFNGLLGEGE